MKWFEDLITNPFFIAGVSSWFVAQVVKTIIHWIIYKKFDIRRLFGDGGMPSGHSATVTAVALMCGLVFGMGSHEFAISTILAIIVCHDAMGVRLETGKQAVVINELVNAFSVLSTEKLPEAKLKEFVGHTPIQVLAGIAVGIINTIFIYNILF